MIESKKRWQLTSPDEQAVQELQEALSLSSVLAKILVTRGQTVKKGERVAKVGSTGVSTGPHVHFEVRKAGKRTNPESVLY